MLTIDPIAVVLSLAGGLAVGGLFFGGLYLTTARLHRAEHPALLMVASFVGRAALVVAAAWFIAVTFGHWGLLGFVVGVTIARLVMVAMIRSAGVAESV